MKRPVYCLVPWVALIFSSMALGETSSKPANPDRVQVLIQTEIGDLNAELFAKEVPSLVSNFVELARKNFYSDTYIYDLVDDIALQFGGKNKSGESTAGYTIDDEFAKNLDFSKPGMLAYSSTGPDMNSSNFLINLIPTPHFQDKYPIFGQITDAPEVLAKMVASYDKKKKAKITAIKILSEDYQPVKFTKRTPFSTDDIKTLSEEKAKSILSRIFKEEELGTMVEIKLQYQSIRGRKIQVAYEAKTDSDHQAKIILLGQLTDKKMELQQFQYQQIKSVKSKD